MADRWKSPAKGAGCPSVNVPYWYYNGLGAVDYPCPSVLALRSASGSTKLSLDFAGRGKVGGLCGGSDTYITFSGSTLAVVDIWKALKDGIWTSSTTIKMYAQDSFAASVVLSAEIMTSTFTSLISFSKLTGRDAAVACPPTLQATVTVAADGTVSIA